MDERVEHGKFTLIGKWILLIESENCFNPMIISNFLILSVSERKTFVLKTEVDDIL